MGVVRIFCVTQSKRKSNKCITKQQINLETNLQNPMHLHEILSVFLDPVVIYGRRPHTFLCHFVLLTTVTQIWRCTLWTIFFSVNIEIASNKIFYFNVKYWNSCRYTCYRCTLHYILFNYIANLVDSCSNCNWIQNRSSIMWIFNKMFSN